jgi:hypothetical protein
MRQLVSDDRVQTGITKQNFQAAFRRRVFPFDGLDVLT